MASALTQMKQLIGLLETALNNANRAEAKGSENEQAIAETNKVATGNDECIMELAEIISVQEECIMELAEIVSTLAE